MMAGSSIMGRILDWEYRKFQRRAEAHIAAQGLSTANITKENFFPLEQVRRYLSQITTYALANTLI